MSEREFLEEINTVASAEAQAQYEILVDQIAELLQQGKKVSPKELAGVIGGLPSGVIPDIIKKYIADLLMGKAKRGRPTSVHPSIDDMFRDPEIRAAYNTMKKEGQRYIDIRDQLAKKYFLSEKSIERIIQRTNV